MRDFTRAAQAARTDIPPPPPPVAPPVVAPVPVVVQAEPRAQSAMREFGRRSPPTFSGDVDPIQAELWLKRITRIFEHLGIVEDHLRIDAATFQLAGRAQSWWELVFTSQTLEGMTWETFTRLFLDKYFSSVARQTKRNEFLNLRQGDLSVAEYEARFGDLSRFALDITTDDNMKARTFENGLRPGLRTKVVGFELDSYSKVVQKALVFEEEFLNSKKEKELRTTPKQHHQGSSSGSHHKKPRQGYAPPQLSYSESVPVQGQPISQYQIPSLTQPQTQSQSRGSRRAGHFRGGSHQGTRACFRCGDTGHFIRDCPLGTQQTPQIPGPPSQVGPSQQYYRPPLLPPAAPSAQKIGRAHV